MRICLAHGRDKQWCSVNTNHIVGLRGTDSGVMTDSSVVLQFKSWSDGTGKSYWLYSRISFEKLSLTASAEVIM